MHWFIFVANFWYFSPPKKKKIRKKTWEKTCCFQFLVSILFSAKKYTTFAKHKERKIIQNATMVIQISKFSHYYNFHGLNHCQSGIQRKYDTNLTLVLNDLFCQKICLLVCCSDRFQGPLCLRKAVIVTLCSLLCTSNVVWIEGWSDHVVGSC
jgi:hypothetical protein